MHFSVCYLGRTVETLTEDLIVVISTTLEKQCMGDYFEQKLYEIYLNMAHAKSPTLRNAAFQL